MDACLENTYGMEQEKQLHREAELIKWFIFTKDNIINHSH